MEDMDIDMAVEIPDTPDRIAAWHSNGRECFGPESNSSLAGNSRNSGVMDEECPNQLRVKGRLVSENGHCRRLSGRPQKNFSNINETACRSSSIILSSPDNLYPSLNGHSVRRTSIDEKSKHEGGGRVDKGKAVRNVFPCKPPGCQEENDILASAAQNEHSRLLETAFPQGASKDLQANGGSTLHCVSNSSKASETACKGKEKSNDKIRKDPTFHSVIFPKVTGRKRLVRNGCISPHNIALRAKELAEREGSSSKEIECDNTVNVVSNVSPSVIDISDIIAEDNTYVRGKGKGVMVHPFSSKEHDARKHKMPSSPVIINGENNGASNASRDAFGCFEGLDGWGSTRNRSKSTHLPLSDAAGCLSGRNEDVGCSINQHPENGVEERDNESGRNSKALCDYPEDWNVAQTASRIVSEPDLMCRPSHAANSHIKRQKKCVLTSRNRGESSTLFSDNSEIVLLGSSGESSNSRSARIQNGQHQGIWTPVIDIDALSPEMRLRDSPNLGCMNIDDSDSRARQVEADEMLARELQDQLYHEVPMVGDGEIDEHIALTLQHEEDAVHATSNGNPRTLHPRGSSVAHLYRQPQSRLVQNASNRRRTQGRVPTSARMARLRSHVSSPSPIVSLRERNLQFPSDMDLDMRLDILEALEDTVGDLSNLRMANHILQVHRDFNENDYEMLLALDEDNHQHIGASVNQINRLPQSTVQTENFEEACAICLELPTTGETIRHLPCLHKFHKDCIDPWLRRKTSCPVCKSSVT